MLTEARNQKLINRINKLIENSVISDDISYTLQEKNGIYQCVISYQKNEKWELFWTSTSITTERGNLRAAKKICEEIVEIFKNTINSYNTNKTVSNIIDFQSLMELNTTNINPNKETKADWDFYKLMEYWLEKVIKNSVQPDTYYNYRLIITGRLKKYFTSSKHKKAVKELTSDDLDDFYDYLRDECDIKNATIDHYNDNISSAFKFLLKKKLVRYNPTDYIKPIVVEQLEVPTYQKADIDKLFEALKGETIELPIKFGCYYGLRRSEIIGLRKEAFDFENNTFIINHVAITNYGKDTKEKVYFVDRTKSKKGCRTFPIIPELKTAVLERIEQIETNKKLFGNTYNYKYDDYLFVHDNGDIINPNYVTKRFKKIIDRNKLKKITPHGLRHSIATLLHIAGVDIRDLQDWLGHESITSTNRYARSDYKKQVSTSKVVLEIFNKEDNRKRFKIKRKKNIYATS